MQERTLRCPQCGVEFTTKWIKQVFCTKRCTQAFYSAIGNAKRKVVYQPRQCDVCGEVYIPLRAGSRTCTPSCRSRLHNRSRSGLDVRTPTKCCLWCGTTFKPLTKVTQKYCTKQCRYEHSLEIGRHERAQNKRHCGDCSAPLSDRGPQARYCKACMKERNRVAVYNKAPLWAECQSCGVEFPQPQRRKNCSNSCAVRAANAKREWHRTCIACGEEFITHDKRPQACGNSCRQWARNFPGVPRIIIGTCEYCQQPFKAHRGDQRFCDKTCNRRKRQDLERAAKNGVPYVEPVTRKYLGERDKWTCQLCGEKVNKRLKYPHPMCASIDHVIPLTRGGEHSRANTQLTHLLCNVRKSNRPKEPQQLALIG